MPYDAGNPFNQLFDVAAAASQRQSGLDDLSRKTTFSELGCRRDVEN
jgi:hypothetical protein